MVKYALQIARSEKMCSQANPGDSDQAGPHCRRGGKPSVSKRLMKNESILSVHRCDRWIVIVSLKIKSGCDIRSPAPPGLSVPRFYRKRTPATATESIRVAASTLANVPSSLPRNAPWPTRKL